MPLTHLVDSRYMMPVFSAPYYEAGVIPVPGGNLPEPPSGGPTCKGSFKVWFNEGGGSTFRDAVEEVRNLAKNAQHGEQLRESSIYRGRRLCLDDAEVYPPLHMFVPQLPINPLLELLLRVALLPASPLQPTHLSKSEQ